MANTQLCLLSLSQDKSVLWGVPATKEPFWLRKLLPENAYLCFNKHTNLFKDCVKKKKKKKGLSTGVIYLLPVSPRLCKTVKIIITEKILCEIPDCAKLSRAEPSRARQGGSGKHSQPYSKSSWAELSWAKLVEGRAQAKPKSIELWVFESVIRGLMVLRLLLCNQESSRYFQSEGNTLFWFVEAWPNRDPQFTYAGT